MENSAGNLKMQPRLEVKNYDCGLMITESLKKVTSRKDLTEEEAYECMVEIMEGDCDEIHISAFLAGLATKGESVEEITGFVKAMRQASIPVASPLKQPLVDTCGTGGDRLKTFNVSTAVAIIAASCGLAVAKHGNRSITSKCGGADILEALGVNINCNASQVQDCLKNTGIGFMYAPYFHPAMGNVMPVRKKLGIKTVFNILGPLTSPANAEIQLLGVFDPDYVEIMVQVLKNLDVKRAMVVHGFNEHDQPAMDEISILGKTKVALLDNGEVSIHELYPEDFGLKKAASNHIKAPETLDENLDLVLRVLKGKKESLEDEVRLNLCLINTAAVLYLAQKTDNLEDGLKTALESVESGAALNKLNQFIQISNQCKI